MSEIVHFAVLAIFGSLNAAAGIKSIRVGRDFVGGFNIFAAFLALVAIGRLSA